MQTDISSLAQTFIDDAVALLRGFANVSGDLVSSGVAGVHLRLSAPVERLAHGCDVAGVLPAGSARRRKRLADLLGLLTPFRGLRDLT